MTKDEALKLALEALNDLSAWNDGEVGGHMDEPYSAEVARRTITAIKEALAQPEFAIGDIRALRHRIHELEGEVIGYKQILDAQPEQEPVAWMQPDEVHISLWKDDYHIIPLYTTPPQRAWVGLTDEEAIQMHIDCNSVSELFDAIDAKLKQKNG